MASNSIPADSADILPRVNKSRTASRGSVDAILRTVVGPLASLKLTVILFAMSIFLIFVGTLAQVDQDMWQVINDYFHSPFVWIYWQVLFPKTWFPTMQSIPGGFPFPGGLTIGVLMFVNLVAAHAFRFKPQANGARLAIGCVIIALGGLLTWAVVASGHSGEGLQGSPPVSWPTMWLLVKAGTGVIGLGMVAAAARSFLAKRVLQPGGAPLDLRLVGLAVLGIGGLGMLLLTIWLFASGAYLGDSGMRILWQLIKGCAAGLLLLFGCVMVFKKRGAIVVIHSGIGLMMLGELLVGTYVTEERMVIDEGDTVNYAVDIRSTELAIIDSSGAEMDDVVAVPMWVKGRKSRFVKSGERIQHEDLPFDIEIVDYFKNSNLEDAKPDDENKATAGKGLDTIAVAARQGSGADSSGEVDMGSAYVRFFEKGASEEIGTFMLSQIVLTSRSGKVFTYDDLIPVGDKQYKVELRFKRSYKSYAMRLADVRKDDYIGTTTPRNYSSDLRLVDASRNVDRDVKIWMNNPLRYAGETLYQSGYHKDPRTGAETTTLQVVRNTGWMIPYVGCMIVAIGLMVHFPQTLVRFLSRIAGARSGSVPLAATVAPSEQRAEVARNLDRKPPKKRSLPKRKRPMEDFTEDFAEEVVPRRATPTGPTTKASIAIAAVIVLVFGAWLLSKTRPAKVANDEMNLPAFGQFPVAFGGRIKPLDTLARNSLRVLSTKERLYTLAGDKEPAIVWLTDVISGSEDGEKHRVFRIDSPDVLAMLKLTRRKGHLYSYAEVLPQIEELRKQVALAKDVEAENMTLYQRKVLELDNRIQLFFRIRFAFGLPRGERRPQDELSELAGLISTGQELAQSPVPYCIPTRDSSAQDNSSNSWEPLTTAVARLWASDLARKYEVTTTRELAQKLVDQALTKELLAEAVEADLRATITDVLREQNPGISNNELDVRVGAALQAMPADKRELFAEPIRRELEQRRQRFQTEFAATMNEAFGAEGLAELDEPIARSMWDMLAAYRQGDVDAFNGEVETYRTEIAAAAPEGYNVRKAKFESFFNHFAPFYNCAAVYVFAFLLTTFGWLAWAFGWNRPFHFSAFGLIGLTFAVHTLALLGRIYISGRPPVTNLYSSAIFIGWAAVLFGLVLEAIFRLGIGNIISATSGFSTLVIAHQLAGDGDTFTVLQAVLDTQFWLATHVVTVTLGYAATFVAGLLGIVFVLGGLLTPRLSEQVGQYSMGKLLGNMIYGVVCFALFFSFVGTVLGGLWADDSWGRFWGWDPKENGALIIVLWNALVLHARWDGMIRERGLAVLAIVGNIVTSWSWFGVNELGVGLHSYGFTSGVLFWLSMFAGSQVALIIIGSLPKQLWWSYIVEAELKKQPAAPA